MVTLTPAYTLAHVLPVDTGLRTGVVGLVTKILTVLIRIVALQGSIGVFTVIGHGQIPTFAADTSIIIPYDFLGAAPPGWDAAELFSVPN